MTSDRELLRQYAKAGDEAAFGEVVRRQVDFVYSTALRVTAGDRQLAQDVSQNVFVKMAQHARRLADYETIVGWLHITTRNTAIKSIRGEQRRRAREREASLMQHESATTEVNWEQVRPVLDEAVANLAEQDRHAVLLRFFKGLSHREVGDELGLTEDTARKRVERALEKMREYFARRGVTVSSALLVSAISANSVQAAPATWSKTVAQAALAKSATGGSGALLAVFMSTKIKLTFLALLLVATIVTIVVYQSSPSGVDDAKAQIKAGAPSPARAAVATPPIPSPSLSANVRPPAPGPETVASAEPTHALAATSPATAPNVTVAELRSELNDAIPQVIHLLESGDYETFLVDFFPGYTFQEPDAVARNIRSNANYQKQLTKLAGVLKKIQDQSPNPRFEVKNGDIFATFEVSPKVDIYDSVLFVRINGKWYFGGPF